MSLGVWRVKKEWDAIMQKVCLSSSENAMQKRRETGYTRKKLFSNLVQETTTNGTELKLTPLMKFCSPIDSTYHKKASSCSLLFAACPDRSRKNLKPVGSGTALYPAPPRIRGTICEHILCLPFCLALSTSVTRGRLPRAD